MFEGLEVLVGNALHLLTSCQQSQNDALFEQKLDSTLSKLISESSLLVATARLDPSSPSLKEFFHRSALSLLDQNTRPLLRSKILLLLSNFFLYNVSLRKRAANSEQTCLAIFYSLRLAIEQQLGTQNVIDVLRILQMLTYERVNFGQWIYELLPMLCKEILSSVTSELLPHCMCILCNLVGQSKAFAKRLKQMDSFKDICARILQLLSHNSKAVVVSALVLVGYLDEKSRDTVYSSQNISNTLLCIFNILASASPDVLMTTHIAVDLLRRLVVSQPKCPNELPQLNPTARNLASYAFFEKSIQKMAGILNLLDPRSEEHRKISQLLLAFCQIDELRPSVCLAIVAIERSEQKLNTPAYAFLRTAQMTFEEDIFPEIPTTALNLLTFVVKESIESGKGMRSLFSSTESICALIRQQMNDAITRRIDPQSQIAPFRCRQIAEVLRLAEALSNDEECRFDLVEIAHAQLCADIFEQHLCTNPIVHQLLLENAPPIAYYCDSDAPSTSAKGLISLPLWSINGVAIPIQMMRLLASLKDYSKAHKDLYWRSLKDTRLLPFIAYAISRGNNEIVYDALVLFTHCAQVHDFPMRKLSLLTAKCASLKNAKLHKRSSNGDQPATENQNNSISIPSPDLLYEYTNGKDQKGKCTADCDEMAKLVAKLQSKLALKEEREKELDKILAKTHTNGTGSSGLGNGISLVGAPSEHLRHFVADLERRVVEADAEVAALTSEKAELAKRVEQLQKSAEAERARQSLEMRAIVDEKEALEEENEKERSLHAVLRGNFDEMTRKFDTAAKAIFDKQSELDRLAKVDREWAQKLAESEAELAKSRAEFEDARRMVGEREIELKVHREDLARMKERNEQLDELRAQMGRLLEHFEGESAKFK